MAASPPARIPAEFLRFAVAGTVGFAVDSGLLLAFTSLLHWPHFSARLVSFAVALVATWLINRAWTFRSRERAAGGIGREFAGYGAVQLTGGAVNYGVYVLVVTLIGKAPLQLLAATACGSVAGMAINYVGARRFVFAQKS